MDNIIKIKEASYSVGRLPVKKQFHISRRLSPFLGSLASHLPMLERMIKKEEDPSIDKLAAMIPDLTETLSKMPDADCDYVIDACLSVVKMQQPNGQWAPITDSRGSLMFHHIDMVTMLQLTGEVVQENLAGFFPTDEPKE